MNLSGSDHTVRFQFKKQLVSEGFEPLMVRVCDREPLQVINQGWRWARIWRAWSRALLCVACIATHAYAQVDVLTYHYDNFRTGLNPSEKALTPKAVSQDTFGLLFTLPVDGAVYAQPLLVTGVHISNKGIHNVLYVATENNSVYAFDANSNTGENALPLWTVNLGPPVPWEDVGAGDIRPVYGITSTPVIHLTGPGAGYIYVIAKTKESNGKGGYVYVQRLHALNIADGGEVKAGPTEISASVPGVGDGNDGSGHVPFNTLIEHNRAALLYFNNGTTNLIVSAWASHGDMGPYHGWVLTFDADSLKMVSAFNTTPNALTAVSGYPIAGGGVWQGGGGVATDGKSLYFATGNGTFDPSTQGYGDSILKMSPQLTVQDYFAPYTQQHLDDSDLDLGSGGVMLLPNDPTYNPSLPLMVQAGKDGTLHILTTTNLGQYDPMPPDHIWGEITGAMFGIWGNPAYFRGAMFFGPEDDPIVGFKISHGSWVGTGVQGQTDNRFSYPGPTPSVSSNGPNDGIVWAVDGSHYVGSSIEGPAQLWAYDATNLAKTLYSSANTEGRDVMGTAVKFVTPLVDGGKVYVGTQNEVDVFGIGRFCANPVIQTPSGDYPKPITVTVTDATPSSKMYYTLDGTTPTETSSRYTGPISVSTSSKLQIKAFAPGLGSSAAVTAYYLIAPVIGTGTGLTGNYYGNMTMTDAPTIVEVDPTINFDWAGLSPVAGVPGTDWSATWTGIIQAPTTGNYTFYTNADDGVRLFVNGNEIINDWMNQSANQKTSAPVAMVAGQTYPIEIEYFQAGGASLLQLSWSTTGMPMQVIPKTQLYP